MSRGKPKMILEGKKEEEKDIESKDCHVMRMQRGICLYGGNFMT